MNKRILVVDDEEAIRKSFILALEDTDYKVDAADSGEKGIEFVINQTYDLIFLDLKMPGLNGVETLQKIREIDNQAIVYFVTAFYGEFLEELEPDLVTVKAGIRIYPGTELEEIARSHGQLAHGQDVLLPAWNSLKIKL